MKVKHEDLPPLVKEANKALEEKNVQGTFSPEPHIEFGENVTLALRPKPV